jgi:predicted adenine nucleotide alpha hydrolase (AANH) superfamily ATPase
MSKQKFTDIPLKANKILLHSCCAPCSTALIDYLVTQNIIPTIFYYNPNIFPQGEYEIRKAENKRYTEALGLDFVDADYNHAEWKEKTWELRNEPERGKRCLNCFKIRLKTTAKYAYENGHSLFTTTLATSRWKDLEQIYQAGAYAASLFNGVTFWANNWRKNGLAVKQAQIIKEYDFYRQQYCGCEYSLRDSNKWRKEQGKPLIQSFENKQNSLFR